MAVRVALVPVLVRPTVARGIALPDGSVTEPSTVQKVDWPKLASENVSQATASVKCKPKRGRRRSNKIEDKDSREDPNSIRLLL